MRNPFSFLFKENTDDTEEMTSSVEIHAQSGIWEDRRYKELFKKGFAFDGTQLWDRNRRFWQMIQFFKSVGTLKGETAEAGCLFGLSSYLICHYEIDFNTGFDGSTHHIFDSFKGLSTASQEDLMENGEKNVLMAEGCAQAESFKGNFMNRTQATLHEFPNVNYYSGWIPDVFKKTERRFYKFVHIDLDLFEPTYQSILFFYPQLVSGGCIIIDDYGFPSWPGVKKATDKWAEQNNCSVIPLITGNAAIIKS